MKYTMYEYVMESIKTQFIHLIKIFNEKRFLARVFCGGQFIRLDLLINV